MTPTERIELAQKCAKCEYSTYVAMMVTEEGEYESEFGRTEYCCRTVRKKVRLCKLIPVVCSELEGCPADTMTDDEIDEKINEFENIDFDYE